MLWFTVPSHKPLLAPVLLICYPRANGAKRRAPIPPVIYTRGNETIREV
jgi:hypothetical protein